MDPLIILCALLAFSCGCAGSLWLTLTLREQRARALFRLAVGTDSEHAQQFTTTGLNLFVLNKLTAWSRDQSGDLINRIPNILQTIAFINMKDLPLLLEQTGTTGTITEAAFATYRLWFTILGLGLGALLGTALSSQMGLVLGCLGAILGFTAPRRALNAERASRGKTVNQQLCNMLEVVILGLQSGLSFNKALSLYSDNFTGSLAREAEMAEVQWSHGLLSREEGLRTIASHYNSPQLTRSMDAIIRSLRFGTSMRQTLSACAEETRQVRKTQLEEAVAKAPVKMLIPVGTLMLPAMLILVVGPVLLELMTGF